MTWQHYTLVFRLQSPLRIGARETGNLLSTHPYVPGRVLWAALTARITRDRGLGKQGDAYKKVGEELQDHLRFGYLYPSLDGQFPYYPWQNPTEFDYLFLNSYVSTALDYNNQSALDGSLHEAEYIAPHTRRNEPVYLTGSLWVQAGYDFGDCKKALEMLQLGGERRYGWGRVALESLKPIANPEIPDPDRFTWGAEKVPAHIHAAGIPAINLNGRVEPLIGWELNANGRKSLTLQVIPAFVPGSAFNRKKGEEVRVECSIAEMGIWKIKEIQHG